MRERLIAQAEALLSEALDPADVLFAVGRLVVLGAAERVGKIDAAIDLQVGAVDEDAHAIVELLERLDDRSPDEIFLEVRDRLIARDRIELCRIGAEHIVGHALEIDLDGDASLVAFDETLRPHLWKLTALNAWRALQARWIEPAYRSRFWWWSEAIDVDPRGAVALGAVASLIARFPDVARRIEKIAVTSLVIGPPAEAEVIDLRGWIEMRLGGALRMAAATAREQVLLEHASFTLSFLAPDTLFVDLLEPRGAAVPRVKCADRIIEGEPVTDAVERYRFELGPLLSATTVELFVSLGSGSFRITLP